MYHVSPSKSNTCMNYLFMPDMDTCYLGVAEAYLSSSCLPGFTSSPGEPAWTNITSTPQWLRRISLNSLHFAIDFNESSLRSHELILLFYVLYLFPKKITPHKSINFEIETTYRVSGEMATLQLFLSGKTAVPPFAVLASSKRRRHWRMIQRTMFCPCIYVDGQHCATGKTTWSITEDCSGC